VDSASALTVLAEERMELQASVEGNFPGVVEAQLGKSHGKTHGKTLEDEDLNLRFSSTMVYQVYPMEKKH